MTRPFGRLDDEVDALAHDGGVMPHSYNETHTNRPEPGKVSDRPETPASRFRSHSAIAFGSGVSASAPALMLTGSLALGALVAALTVVCVGLAALMI